MTVNENDTYIAKTAFSAKRQHINKTQKNTDNKLRLKTKK